ncbi:MAG: hypothetical protein IJF67_13580 [Clostridia bacterium]|nr:hypothetical protein [Clostridia bacterium]
MNRSCKIKSIFIFAMALALLLLGAACTDNAPEDVTAPDVPIETLAEGDAVSPADFTIMRADVADEDTIAACLTFKKQVQAVCGAEMTLGTDWVKRGAEIPTDTAEIVIGDTNRRASAGMRRDDWTIEREGSRIYILGGSGEALQAAVEFFLDHFLTAGGMTIPDNYGTGHTGDYALEALQLGDTETVQPVICARDSVTKRYAEQIAAQLGEKLGIDVEITNKPEESNIVFTSEEGHGIEKGSWGLSCENGRLCIVGRSELEIKKAAAYFREQLDQAAGTLAFAAGVVHSEHQRTKEEYYDMTQLVIYPEFPEQINRDHLYTVTVTQGEKSAELPVYNHTQTSNVTSRAVGGDLYRRFSAFAFSGEGVRVDIEVGRDFKTYSVMPSAKNFKSEYKDGVISVYLDKPDYFLIRLDNDDNSILSVFADYPEFEDEIPDRNDPDVIWIDGWFEPETGLYDVKEDNKTLYIAPGAVLNARVNINGKNVKVMGRGAIVDPFEDIYSHPITDGGTEGKGRKMLTISGAGSSADGLLLLDARCFNVAINADNVTVRNIKCMSTMMTTDGISVYGGRNALAEHCFLYVGDNSMVFSATDTIYRDITTGTTCAVIFPQGNPVNTLIEDLYCFRLGEGLLNHQYNPSAKNLTATVTIRNADAMDCIYLPHFARMQKMGIMEKTFVFENISIPLPTGICDPYQMGGNTTLRFINTAETLYTENYQLKFTNFSVNGKLITDASQIVIKADGTPKNTYTFASDGSYKPVAKHIAEANYTMPDKVYVGDLQITFDNKPIRDGGELLLAADEMQAALRTDKLAATVSKDGRDYIKASELVKSGMAAEASERNGCLYITPNYNGENLLLPDSGEISKFVEATCYNVDMIVEKEGDTTVYTCTTLKAANGGMTRFITDEVRMYGAGTYRLTFRAKAASACTANVIGYIESKKSYTNFTLGTGWKEFSADLKFTEADMASPMFAFAFTLKDTIPASYSISDIRLVKVG